MRRNGGNPPVAPAGGGVDSPRFKILVFLLYFTLTFVAVRVWMVIVDTENVYLEAAGALVTLLFLYCLYWYFQRLMTLHRQRMEALREGRRADYTQSGDVDLDAVQLRIQLRRLYGEGVDVDTLLQQGLPWETINSCLRYFTFNRDKCHPHTNNMTNMGNAHDAIDSNIVIGSSNDNDNNGISYSDLEQGLNTSQPLPAVSQECAVCLCDFADGDALIELPCKHAYHQGCITDWLLTHNACPLCKQCVVKLVDLRRIIDRMLDQQDVTGGTTGTADSAYSVHSTLSLHGNNSVHSVHSVGNSNNNSEGAGRLLISTLLRTAIQEEDDLQQHQLHALHSPSVHGSSVLYTAVDQQDQEAGGPSGRAGANANSVADASAAGGGISHAEVVPRSGRINSIDSIEDVTRPATYTL